MREKEEGDGKERDSRDFSSSINRADGSTCK